MFAERFNGTMRRDRLNVEEFYSVSSALIETLDAECGPGEPTETLGG